MSTASTTPKRVLMLHGFSSNASSFSRHSVLTSIRRECANQGNEIELVHVDPPYIPSQDYPSELLDQYNANGFVEFAGGGPRPWWRMNTERTKAVGLDKTFMFIRDLMSEKPFDGIFGLSQGAAFAILLAALLERPEIYPPFLKDGKPPQPPVRFCIVVGAFGINDPISHTILGKPYKTPTLHIIGKSDGLVVPDSSRKVATFNTNARIEEHDGGHFIPSRENWIKFYASYIDNPLGDVPSPESASKKASVQSSFF